MDKFGLDVLAMMGSQCQTSQVASIEHDDVAVTDEELYDPSNPENIAPATQEEVEKTNAMLLAKQIAKLEAYTARRRAESKIAAHYTSVVSTLRSREAAISAMFKSQLSHRRARSQPDLVQVEEVGSALKCRANSEALAAVPEDVSAAFEEDLESLTPDDELPVVNVVRSCPTWLINSTVHADDLHMQLKQPLPVQCLAI